MAYGSNNTGMAVVLVGLMLIGSLAFFLFAQTWTSLNPDPAEDPHEYAVTGTIGGEVCTGAGSSEYRHESSNVYTYQFVYEVSSSSQTVKGDFGLICDRDGTPISDLYTYVGSGEIDGTPVTVWKWSEHGKDYRIWIASECKVMEFLVQGGELDIRGDLLAEGSRPLPFSLHLPSYSILSAPNQLNRAN
ncbi:MAG: hypothetical protein II933_01600 [Candidatus Methanomethylophilaceae archaeon]|nr:hypothetical protein [Candidatus Methanomethylophilaceae archaeon]